MLDDRQCYSHRLSAMHDEGLQAGKRLRVATMTDFVRVSTLSVHSLAAILLHMTCMLD